MLGRGALLLGLAFVFFVDAHADQSLRDAVRHALRDQSYMLIESPGEPPRLLLLSKGSDDAEAMSRLQLLVDLNDPDPEVRSDALLDLAEDGDADADNLLEAALGDPSPHVRETAEAILEDREDAGRSH